MSRSASDTTRSRTEALTAADLLRVEPTVSAVVSDERAERRVASERRSSRDVDWSKLEPRGAYAALGRPLAQGLLILAVLPFAVAIAIPIAIVNLFVFGDPRQILFSQERVGHRGQVFRIHKFRTMKSVKASSFESWSGDGDALRVTRFGRFLRNSHLDELPQLLNVVKGEMSIVGPRPEMVEIEAWGAQHVEGFTERLAVRPGITGYAQITQGYVGRSVEGYARKHELCMRYLERVSLRTDLSILLRTFLWMARRQGWRWQD